ncbi:methionyl-tRNA formyltransferase [Anabaena sp. FACHB-1237]|uniref:methionyl-tRNA formyltransferase n=1 Tax=Anabaena sp. FACHB-1237 TaxID=2692769 RepID=UPI0016811932|nr:methionyl-tRNA formyltransferase [Anabaena sp. FACHB-1237]MBD2136075.1 methionyl-tRNA formyltransferase [Anabaena sp. FACHB-1237]
MKIVFFGTPDFAVPTLERLIQDENFQVSAVVTQPDKRRERGNKMTPSPVKILAINHHIPVWQPERIKKDVETLTKLKQLEADIFVVVAYGQILSQKILNMPKFGCVNVHGSILPQYRGAAPIQWCLYHGEAETGITTMLMDRGMDTGDMLLKATTFINPLDNAETLADRLAVIGADLLIETALKLENQEITGISQDHNLATYASLITKNDYNLDWWRTAIALHNQIRGFYPHCVTRFRNQPLKIMATIPLETEYIQALPQQLQDKIHKTANLSTISGEPGEIVAIIKGVGAVVQTGLGLLLLLEVQLTGKRPYSGWDFVNGSRLVLGEKLTIEN